MKTWLSASILIALLALPLAAHGEEDSGGYGINIDLGYSSSYMWRGWNVFQDEGIRDQNMLIAPSITWNVFDTGLSLGAWGGFQISGDDILGHIDSGAGAEIDLSASYSLHLMDDLSLSFDFIAYLYPFAEEEAAGTGVPTYLEPAVGVTYTYILSYTLKVAYMLGLQEAVESYRYIYINPSISKHFSFLPFLGLNLSLAFGYKLFHDRDEMDDYVYDLLFTAAVPITLGQWFYVKPALGVTWANVGEKDFADEVGLYGALNGGVNF